MNISPELYERAIRAKEQAIRALQQENRRLKERLERLRAGLCQECYELLIEDQEKPKEPYLRELPSGDFEKVYPEGWPMPPGPERPNVIRRREA